MVHLADTLLITPGGHDLPVSLAAAVIQDESSAVAGYSLVMTDLREIKAAERLLQQEKASVERKVVERTHELAEARAELEASIRSLPFGFAIVTPNNEVAFSNAQLSTLFNYPIPEGLSASKTALAAVSKDFAGTIDLIGCLEESRRSLAPIEKHVEFGPRFYRFVFLPITTDAKQVIGSALLMEDTTEAKAQERSRDEFFSIASHELRTPLTAIRGNSDMILQYYQQILQDPDLKQMINDIHDGSIRLISIVNDFLDVSRLEQRNIQFKNTSFDPVPVIEAILREFNVTGSRKKLTLALDPPASTHVPIYADPDRFRQIIINLVSNAIKFTEQGGITITIKSTDSVVQAAVTDTGHGIPLESQHLLFRKFQQAADSILTRSDTRSTGLGLYISKLLAEGMGGKLYLEKTEVGKGSTFVLDLPKASTDQPNPA